MTAGAEAHHAHAGLVDLPLAGATFAAKQTHGLTGILNCDQLVDQVVAFVGGVAGNEGADVRGRGQAAGEIEREAANEFLVGR